MGHTIVTFETKPLETCVGLTKKIDQLCFPQEMWLGGEELDMLLQHHAESTIITRNGTEIGQAITLPEPAMTNIVKDVDLQFLSRSCAIYSYSEAIVPGCQNQGYGVLLLHEIAIRMRERGYTTISAHVRTRYGWNKKRSKTLPVSSTRLITDFWDDPREVVEYQEARL